MTVKTQGGKVVTKNGKVSCSCCEGPEPGVCCLYPGLPFVDGFYGIDDLPDSIVITLNGSQYVLSKTGDTFPQAIYSGTGGGFAIEIYSGWRVYLNPGEEDEQFFDFDCLVSDAFSPGDGATESVTKTEDQFADTYTVSGSISGTVTRESVCVWRGTGLTLTNFGYQWKINGNNKSGFQNTPVGSYAGGFTVS